MQMYVDSHKQGKLYGQLHKETHSFS